MLLPQGSNTSSNSNSNSLTTDDLLRLLIVNMAQSNSLDLANLASNNSGSNSGSGSNWTGLYAVAINALWFCSLICSLAAASISILVKQWLNQYTSGMASVSPEIARVRQFRYDSLKKWRVAELMMLLPILLQSALVLFLLGLILFLSQLNTNVTIAATTLIVMLLSFLLITAFLPTFIPDCPYQSPQAWGVFIIFQTLKKPIRSIARSLSSYVKRFATPHADGPLSRFRARLAKRFVKRITRFANKPNTYSWKARERILVESKGQILDQHLLVGADVTFLDDTFLRDIIRPCLNDMPAKASAECYHAIMAHRADHVVNGVLYFENRSTRPESTAILTDITLDTLQKTRRDPDYASIEHPIRIMHTLEPLLVRSLPLTYSHFCRVFFGLLADPDTTFCHLAFKILYQQLSRNLLLAEQYNSSGCHGTRSSRHSIVNSHSSYDFALHTDLNALLAFISRARTDEDTMHFLDACDLVVCLASLPTPPPNDNSAHLRTALAHLETFFARAPWHAEPRLLYPLSRIAPHLAALGARCPRALVDVLAQVTAHAQAEWNHDGNWEDKLIVLERTLEELRAAREEAPPVPNESSSQRGHGRKPSLMRSPGLVQLE